MSSAEISAILSSAEIFKNIYKVRCLIIIFYREALAAAMKKALLETVVAYFFGQGRIRARTHKLNVTAFFLFQPNSSLKFENVKDLIKKSTLRDYEKEELNAKFDDIREKWKKIGIETLSSIDKTLEESNPSLSESQQTLISETTKLVIGGRTFASQQSTSKPHGLEEEISRYQLFSFAEFVKCKFVLISIKIEI